MTPQFDAIEQKIRAQIIARRFPEMSDAQVTHQTYQSLEGAVEGMRGRMKGLAEEPPSTSGSTRHQFVYHKQFGTGEAVLHRTVIVITDDRGEVQRVFSSR